MASIESSEPTRRDFLYIATGAFAAVGVGAVAWPLIDQMNPDAASLALATSEVNVANIAEGQSVIIKWRGKPVVVRNRTAKEIDEAKKVELNQLIDPVARNQNLPDDAPATDANRAAPGKEQWLVMVQICTHLGCVPLGQQGDYDGWFCPCHGSQYDSAGRVRHGPAPLNMDIPPYKFTSDSVITIG